MTDEQKTLVTQLMLLFDGKQADQIAEALVSAIGHQKAGRLAGALDHLTGVNVAMTLSPEDIIEEATDGLWSDDEKYEVVGTREQLADLCRNHVWDDMGSLWRTEMDDLFVKAIEAGLVKKVFVKPKDDSGE